MGLHWTGMASGDAPMVYRPMEQRHRAALERYVHAGKPILAHHGAVASYDDWPDFGRLVGLAWVWGRTSHSPVGMHHVSIRPTPHPVIKEVEDFSLVDELYYDLELASDVPWQAHAQATWDGAERPMVLTSERDLRRGRRVYLANGHDLRAFDCPALLKLWMNSINWLCERE
jgi:type 1 glutamine amidotransferase